MRFQKPTSLVYSNDPQLQVQALDGGLSNDDEFDDTYTSNDGTSSENSASPGPSPRNRGGGGAA